MVRNPPPTVLIVDDEIDIRTVVRVVLESAKRGIEVVGEAIDGAEALETIERLRGEGRPDVVILDHRMPGRSGLETAKNILAAVPEQRIILFGTTITPKLEADAMAAGIAACVGKLDVDRLPDLVLTLAASPRPERRAPGRRRSGPLNASTRA